MGTEILQRFPGGEKGDVSVFLRRWQCCGFCGHQLGQVQSTQTSQLRPCVWRFVWCLTHRKTSKCLGLLCVEPLPIINYCAQLNL